MTIATPLRLVPAAPAPAPARPPRPRRHFLGRVAAILAGAVAPWIPAPAAATGRDGDGAAGREALAVLPAVDGLRIGPVAPGDAPAPGAIELGLFRYDSAGGAPADLRRLVLPWPDVAAGLYVRSAVPYHIRVLVDPGHGGLTTRLILARRAPVSVYRETPGPGEVPPCQVVLVVDGGGDARRAAIG